MRILTTCLLLFVIFASNAQQESPRYHLKGIIINAKSKKQQKYVSIHILPYDKKIQTDSKGQFKLNLPQGEITLTIDHSPFDKKIVKLEVNKDTVLNIELQSDPSIHLIDEVEVIAHAPMADRPTAVNRLEVNSIRFLPALNGERDILKAFSLTSGVSSAAEGSSQIQVRGGTHGQNLFLLDDAPLYSTQHMMGMVSTYNSTIIKSAELYKSGFPSEFGGKLSGIIDVQSNDANTKKLNGEAELGLLSTKASLNLPIIKDKVGISVAGRISNYSLINLMNLFTPKDGTKIGLDFADINSNLTWHLSESSKLRIGMFYNRDGLTGQSKLDYYTTNFKLGNEQEHYNILWTKKINEQLSNRLTLYTNNYKFDYDIANKEKDYGTHLQIATAIRSFTVKDKLTIQVKDHLHLNCGVEAQVFDFSPVIYKLDTASTIGSKINYEIRQYQGSGFVESKYQLKKWTFITGIRATSMGTTSKVYSAIEPRMNVTFRPSSDLSFNASACKMTQPIHRIANNGLGFPFEIFAPSSTSLKPESSWNFSLGMGKDFSYSNYQLSFKTDVWYKTFSNLVEFKDGHDINSNYLMEVIRMSTSNSIPVNTDINSIVTQGKGVAYGLDLSTTLDYQRFKFTLDYTLMKATNQFAELNQGRPFAAPTDMRHTLSTAAEVKLSDTWTFSATWQFHTGKPITVPKEMYPNPFYTPNDYYSNQYTQVIPERNNYRFREFHRLDIAFSHKYKAFKKYDGLFSVGIYNVYNRANPYLYYIDSKDINGTPTPVLKSMSIFPILPSVSWSVRF